MMSIFDNRKHLLAQMAQVSAEMQAQDREARISEEAQEKFQLHELDARFQAYQDSNPAMFVFVREFIAKELDLTTRSLSRIIRMAKKSSPELGDLLLAVFEANISATLWGNKTLIEEERALPGEDEIESEAEATDDDDSGKGH